MNNFLPITDIYFALSYPLYLILAISPLSTILYLNEIIVCEFQKVSNKQKKQLDKTKARYC